MTAGGSGGGGGATTGGGVGGATGAADGFDQYLQFAANIATSKRNLQQEAAEQEQE